MKNENYQIENNSQDGRDIILQQMLQKENETLKRLGKKEIDTNLTLSSLILLLEMQRERITFLEQDKSHQKTEELNFKLTNREFLSDTPQNEKRLKSSYNIDCSNSKFDLNAIKSFSSFSNFSSQVGANINKKRDDDLSKPFTPSMPSLSSELEYYKKKCNVLEQNLEEKRNTDRFVNVKDFQTSTKDESIYSNNKNKQSSNFYTPSHSPLLPNSKKKTLTPISSKMNFI